jgi:hypothetical protein
VESWSTIKGFFSREAKFLTKPEDFVSRLDLNSRESRKEALVYLLLGGGLSFFMHKINIRLYDERVRRVIPLDEKTANDIFLVAAVVAFGLFCFIAFRVLGGKASFFATIVLLMYVVGFVSPVLTLLLIGVTRIVSAALGIPVVLVPPAKVVPLDIVPSGQFAMVVVASYTVVLWLWNLYLAWILWVTFSRAHEVSRARGLFGTVGAMALLWVFSGPIGRAVDFLLDPVREYLEWLP